MSKQNAQTHLTIAARFQKGPVYLRALIVERTHSLLKFLLIYLIVTQVSDPNMIDALIALVSKSV
jgi:hypothetical protein